METTSPTPVNTEVLYVSKQGKVSPYAHQNVLSCYETATLPKVKQLIVFPLIHPLPDPTGRTMKCLQWHGNKIVRVAERVRPIITEPKDVIVQVTTTSVCGSDLHLYHHAFSGMQDGDILGHEAMGIVESVGPDVKTLQVGDRVVVSAIISCGECSYCMAGLFSNCDCTNPSKEMETLYGHRTAGLFGYSHLTGGYDGGQAEYLRVPYADVNCLKVPPTLTDEQVILLSDVACTAWHANVCGGVGQGNTVAVWGLGPVGLMACMWAKFRGAARVIGIDDVESRLECARAKLGIEVIDFSKVSTVTKLQEMVPGGPDVAIDCAGFRFAKGFMHKLQRSVRLESDSPEVLTECIRSVRKGGTVSVIGDYYSHCNTFPTGAFMEKGLTMRGGQLHCQAYWKDLLGYIEQGKIDPTFIITHVMPLEKGELAYNMFDKRKDGAIKILLKTAIAPTSK